MRLGIICPAEIAFRRFMPALQRSPDFEFVGVGVNDREERFGREEVSETIVRSVLQNGKDKAQAFVDRYGGKLFSSYKQILSSDEIDAVYLPLPPALHYKWAKYALENGKHVLIEKPSTISASQTRDLVQLARSKKLALHENYMFMFHDQIAAIDEILASGEIGEVRLYRVAFGFPRRDPNDFRYNRELGGGALIDAGGYTIKYAAKLLGDSAKIRYAQMNHLDGFDVDIYGSAALTNENGTTVQIAYGMDNSYKCELEVWGSKGCLRSDRVLTAPAGFVPKVVIRKDNVDEIRELPEDDAFLKSIDRFYKCIGDEGERERNYDMILRQAEMVEQFRAAAMA